MLYVIASGSSKEKYAWEGSWWLHWYAPLSLLKDVCVTVTENNKCTHLPVQGDLSSFRKQKTLKLVCVPFYKVNFGALELNRCAR